MTRALTPCTRAVLPWVPGTGAGRGGGVWGPLPFSLRALRMHLPENPKPEAEDSSRYFPPTCPPGGWEGELPDFP